ncbi:MAG TPA: c-type cytochrome [Planctomycetota bacterium]|nr:c-type cytochrome [Planctomycetota bacterium]
MSWSAVIAAAALSALAQEPAAPAPPQEPRVRGAKVTFERPAAGDQKAVVHSQRARLLSLAVERGETPSPFVPVGMFRATWHATVPLPARDRFHFRIEGRGSVKLWINDERVLDGALRSGKPLETTQPVRLKKGDNQLRLVFESGAMGDGQLRLFWSGSEFGFEPIFPEQLQWAAGDAEVGAGEQLREGQQLFVERRCARCHEFEVRRIGESAFAELDAPGPDLRGVGARVKQPWIAAWLRDPKQFRPDATMPRHAFEKPQDADDLATWLAESGSPPAAPALAADAAATGAVRFLELGCVACHPRPGQQQHAAEEDRIALDFAPQKWHAAALVAYLQDPRRDHAHSRMPDFALSRDDAQNLAAYLLAPAVPPLPASRGEAQRGKVLAQRHACTLCHALDLPVEESRAPRLRNLDAARGCLADRPGHGRAPDHGLSKQQRAALRAFLPFAEEAPFRPAPVDFVTRHLRADRCTACHGLDGEPSRWARLAEQASKQAPLPTDQDPVAQGVPALTWVGSKLQPSWIARFVQGQEKSPRPWLHARMPAFHVHGAAIASGLVREHGYGPADEPPVAGKAQAVIDGERLVAMGTGFGCVQCHAVGDKPAIQPFERIGIELVTARGRLRHEYYTRWLQDPPRLDPDARMPKYSDAKGRTAFTEILGGDAAQQFEAIWQYLGSLQATRR